MLTTNFIEELSKLRPASTFLTLTGYRNEYGEKADYSLVFHFSYENALRRSLSILDEYKPEDTLHIIAKQELMDSCQESLWKIANIPLEEIEDGYMRFFDEQNNYIKGIKLHLASDTLHLYGLINAKRIIIPGVYPKRNKRELTKAKDELRRMTPMGKFRQFKITPDQVEKIAVEKIALIAPISPY